MSATVVHGFIDDVERTRRLAEALGAPFGLIDLHVFPDGETLPTLPVFEARTAILYRSLHHPQDRLFPTLLAADAYRRVGVERLVLVAPYLCYLRQDAVFRPGQPLSRDVICGLLGQAFDAVVTVQAHLHRTPDLSVALGRPAVNLDIAAALAEALGAGPDSVIVGPDMESAPWVAQAASAVGARALTFSKVRHGDHAVELSLPRDARLAGHRIVLLDDVCSSGGTLEAAVGKLVEAGAAAIDIGLAHALFDTATLARLRAAGAGRVLSSDSIPHSTTGLDLAPRLARALQDEGYA
jgi:ribose-phosphate pyrophosphokinase